MDAAAATNLLWTTYHPQYKVWIPFACIGLVAIVALVIREFRRPVRGSSSPTGRMVPKHSEDTLTPVRPSGR